METGYIMEKTLKVPFGEVNLVRVVCKRCGDAAIETPLMALANNAPITCPGCGTEFRRPGVDTALVQFAKGLLVLPKHKEAEFQFVLPLEGQETSVGNSAACFVPAAA